MGRSHTRFCVLRVDSDRVPCYSEMAGGSMKPEDLTIEKLKELYPDEVDCSYFCVCDYSPLDSLIEGEEVVVVSDDDYQGETRILMQRTEDGCLFKPEYAFHTYSWGSCSGCDALQGCSSWEELLDYAKSHIDGIEWLSHDDTIKKLHEMIDEYNQYSWHDGNDYLFIRECFEFLGESIPDSARTGEDNES